MTTVEQQQSTIAETREQIMELLHLDEDRFHHTMYEVGMQYLHAYYGDDKNLIDYVATRKIFWSWWKTKWFERDRFLLNNLNLEDCTLDYKHRLYANYHNANVLAAEIFPGKVIYGNNFSILKSLNYAS